MARTEEQILSQINEEEKKYSVLSTIAQDATTSRYGFVKKVIAFVVNYLERLFDTFQADIEKFVVDNRFGSLGWFISQAKAFQVGDSLVNLGTHWGYLDTTSDRAEQRRIVKRVRVFLDSDNNVNITPMRVDSAGVPSYLNSDDRDRFKAYMETISPLGITIKINTISGFLPFGPRIQVYEDRDVIVNGVIQGETTNAVRTAIQRFLDTFPLDDPKRARSGGALFYNGEIEKYVRANVPGVININIDNPTYETTNPLFTGEKTADNYRAFISKLFKDDGTLVGEQEASVLRADIVHYFPGCIFKLDEDTDEKKVIIYFQHPTLTR